MRVLFAAALLLAACAPTPHPDASAPAAETDRAAPPAPDEVGAFQERVSVDPAFAGLYLGRGGFVAEDQSRAPVTSFVQMRMPAGAELQALARGVLTLRDGCLRLGEGPDSRLIVWPSSAVLEIEGRVVRVRDQRMHTSVTLGDTIEMGGGESQALVQSALTAPTRCPGPYWGAASGWRRIQN